MTESRSGQDVRLQTDSATERVADSPSPAERAHELAESHVLRGAPAPTVNLLTRLPVYENVLREIHAALADKDLDQANLQPVAEWILDNYYILQQALREVRQDMPQGYYRQLNKLSTTELAGYPRICAIALQLIESDDARLDLGHARQFVDAYQEVLPLTMGEIWALPTMLRLCVVEVLARTFARLGLARLPREATTPGLEVKDGAADTIVGNCVLGLRALAEEDWDAFFESLSLVERALRRDPAGVYAAMDFDTRNRYRQAIEALAFATEHEELAIAAQALQLAESASAGGEDAADEAAKDAGATGKDETSSLADPQRHVGYYLVGTGRAALEQALNCCPRGSARLRRWLSQRPTLAYLGSIALPTLLFLAALAGYARGVGGTPLQLLAVGLFGLIPILTLAISLNNWVVTHLVPPSILPKLDFRDGIRPGCDTMVVIPALLTSPQEVASLLRQLERHFLGNTDARLHFALLTDYGDASQPQQAEDESLVAQAEAGIRALNERYCHARLGPFYLFHRERRWNAAEGVWMGWERKRGKLEEFNRLILGKGPTSFIRQVGDLEVLRQIRYVITLDADTILPPGSAARLVGTLAHPLNRAQFDPKGEKVIAGYTVLQPRTEVALTNSSRSRFSQAYAGDGGLDLYTRAVSDVYQDLFGEGNFVGKGIYDVAAFNHSLEDLVPENTLLSHDLFEGLQGRAGLVSDIILYEDYPPNYLVYAHRTHRWIRGDWQLLPWLLPKLRRSTSQRYRDLSAIGRWKILDNLRRSLLAPAIMTLLVLGWLWLPGGPWFWTLFGILTLAAPIVTAFLTWSLRSLQTARGEGGLVQDVRQPVMRWLLALVFLPYEAIISGDAIVSTLIRLTMTRRHMLQWTTAAHTVRLMGREWKLGLAWRKMWGAPLLAAALAAAVLLLNPSALWAAAPLLLVWLLSPHVAWWISRPMPRERATLSVEQQARLRRLARRTWLYFERFVGPSDNWLPPDHFQEAPRGSVAHRTSPTNIGLALLSTLAAYDMGYMGLRSLVVQLSDAFDTLDKLERYRGHFLNWYDTQSLGPLPPRYVSTVDSGNLAACLIALRQGCLELLNDAVPRPQRWQGLLDTLDVLAECTSAVAEAAPGADKVVRARLEAMRARVRDSQEHSADWARTLSELRTEELPALVAEIEEMIDAHRTELDPKMLGAIGAWLERVDHHILAMQRDLEHLSPCHALCAEAPEYLREALPGSALETAWQALSGEFTREISLVRVPEMCDAVHKQLSALSQALTEEAADQASIEQREAVQAWCMAINERLEPCETTAKALTAEVHRLCDRAWAYVEAMDFAFLFNKQRKVFHIGYNVDDSRLDNNYYDLLASEARIASLIAIAKGEVPASHWLHMARPLAAVDGAKGLLSWNGSMFEYLMPTLLLRQYNHTLLAQSVATAVECQIAYGRQQGVPWGISESGYYRFDNSLNYQYRGFGVPGLGLKRGLGEDLVITPYACLLALPVAPGAALENVDRLISLHMLGTYGFYEAMDFTPARRPAGQRFGRVQSYMSHHQGMVFLSLANELGGASDGPMVRRFHRDPRVQSVELLLQEQVPRKSPLEEIPQVATSAAPARPHITADSWPVPVETPFPEVHYLSNGRYGVLITNAGGGFSSYTFPEEDGQTVDLTRWRADTTLDDWGSRLFLQDRDTGELWSAYRWCPVKEGEICRVFFAPHKAEFHTRVHEIAAHTEITVSPTDDVEIRLVRLTNHTGRPRRLRLTSYAEVALAPHETDRRHPAFAKLFIESEYLPEVNGLVLRRRPRSPDEPQLYLLHSLVPSLDMEITGAHESDRARFLGRLGTLDAPAGLAQDGPGLSGTTGAVLDPVMALGQEINLGAYETAEVALVTLVAGSRREALAAAKAYGEWAKISQAQEGALVASERELRDLVLTVPELARYQQLLSLLFYPHAELRAQPETLAENRGGQAGLWPYAISGDHPILLVRVQREEEAALVDELLRAHVYWRRRNLKIDLVILNDEEGGYAQKLLGHLLRLIVRSKSEMWLERRGGVFLLRAASLGEGEAAQAARVLLYTAARVVLHGANGTLADQLKGPRQMPARLPALAPARTLAETREPTPPLARPVGLRFDNGTGGFSTDGREYVIYLAPRGGDESSAIVPTPAPWVNVIANPDFGFMVSEAGGGYTWSLNSGENRLTPWRNDPVGDRPSEALYLRDEETAEIWSPTPAPAGERAPYLIRHGAGYSIFEHHSHGLKQRLELYAAHDAAVKFVRLRVENTWNRTRRITATYYAEWVLGTDRETTQPFVISEYDTEHGALLARNPYHAEFGQRVAFLAANKPPHGATADRAEFLGRLGELANPAALQRIGLAGAVGPGLDPCAALQLHMDLAPGATEEVHFLLGQGADRDDALRLVGRYRDPTQAETARLKAAAFWDETLGSVSVQTPDPALDLMLNRWLLYQTISCRVWGRSALYQSSGAFGFRDQLQDVLALLHAAPGIARRHLLRAARQQFPEGDVLHWWHESPKPNVSFPLSRGVRTRISDNFLWLPFAAAQYVEVTGDRAILDEQAPYLAGEPLEPNELERYALYASAGQAETFYQHCRRAAAHGRATGSHGLPLIGAGDWNDGMNRVGIGGRGESVWLAWFRAATLRALATVAESAGDASLAGAYRGEAQRLAEAIEAHAWDGAWYVRAYYDDGQPLGSARNSECRIDSIAQSWAVLSGSADPGRARQAMDAVYERLVDLEARLLLLFTPPFDKTQRDPGYIKGYPPGIRENGGQYTHAAIWAARAFAELGDGDRAAALFRLLNPIYHADTPEKVERYRVEPYVVAADIGSQAPHVGRGGWTWYTGSAGWMVRLGLEGILGLQRQGDKLRINPCIPGSWDGYTVTYRFNTSTYTIRVENPDGVNRGIAAITVDGETLPDSAIHLLDDGREHSVHVRMGDSVEESEQA
jgi:cyclic beta-1,2-glucan synthetase